MAYRPFKRVLRETSLERKCRYLFGFCLTLAISLAFLMVDRVAEGLILKTTERRGRDNVDLNLMERHWTGWETGEREKEYLEEFRRDVLYRTYQGDVLALDQKPRANTWLAWGKVLPPVDEHERVILEKLKAEQESQLAAFAAAVTARGADAEEAANEGSAAAEFAGEPHKEPKSELRLVSAGEMQRLEGRADAEAAYWYYQPVYWKRENCGRCHNPNGMHAFAMADSADMVGRGDPPFQVIRITIPAADAQTAVNTVRAVLLAVGILTVVLAIIAMYAIVKFVIIKPLKHLREVSDDIARGKTDVRAKIDTKDEFEDLGASFNKMLRHLIDAQSELRQANVTLDAKVDELAQLNMRLYEMNRLKGDFLANMSHELRTPLNSIIGFSDVLQGIDSLSEKQRRYAQNIQKSGRLLLEMINDILDLAKLEAGKMDIRLSEFRIETVVQAHCDLVRSLTEEKNIDLEVVIQPNTPPLYQDQGKVQQILTNLLSNAIKFTPEGGRITVSAVWAPDDMLRLTVADTGVGIAEEDRDIIFEKFRQGGAVLGPDGFTREYSGTGLGLSIVKELCKLLGGEITFESELGKGSEFTVTLPWMRKGTNRPDSPMAARLDELARGKRADLVRERTVAAAET